MLRSQIDDYKPLTFLDNQIVSGIKGRFSIQLLFMDAGLSLLPICHYEGGMMPRAADEQLQVKALITL